jgi:hypothetical protein
MAQQIKAGVGLYPAKTAGGVTTKESESLTTVTAFVTINGQGHTPFLLTCGHSFRDADENENRDTGTANNCTGIVPANAAPIAPADQICWALRIDRYNFQASAISYLQYHCPGDKLNSNFDGGLAQVIAGIPITNVSASGFNINAYDAQLPPANDPATSHLYLGSKQFLATHRAALTFRAQFQTTDGMTYHNVYVVRADEPENSKLSNRLPPVRSSSNLYAQPSRAASHGWACQGHHCTESPSVWCPTKHCQQMRQS